MNLTLNFITQYRSVSVQSRHFVELNTNENLNSIERFELSTKQWPRCGLMHQFAVYFPYYFEKQFHIDCLNASWKQKAQSFCIHKYVYDRIYITYSIQHGTVQQMEYDSHTWTFTHSNTRALARTHTPIQFVPNAVRLTGHNIRPILMKMGHRLYAFGLRIHEYVYFRSVLF